MTLRLLAPLAALLTLLAALPVRADVGDPQIGTDHPWYSGEMDCSTFERLANTEARLYERVLGTRPHTDQEKALAAWMWRNTHYWHGEEGAEDLWGKGFKQGGDLRTRDYWTGLFAHGYGLCGTTHSQWVAEMESLFGHGRGRCLGVAGHNSFEVFLTGGPYGQGKWVLLDHDLSTVIFNRDGTALLSIPEVKRDWKHLTDRNFVPEKQHGWLVCGLHPNDGSVYQEYNTAEYLAGYAGVPPLVHLRRGETLRRYLQPGLADGKTFVFWGRDAHTGDIPGPERSLTWVNQPEKMHGSHDGPGYRPGQARYANAVYTYRPNFHNHDYREGVVAEDEHQVTFEFYTPYIIGATPAVSQPWGIYEPGCRNGLVLHGRADCNVSVSTDQGQTWHDAGRLSDGLDLTDQVKGHRQYLLRLQAGAEALAEAGLTITTVCQANSSVMPQLAEGGSMVRFEASNRAVLSAGPNLPQAEAHVVAGKFGTPDVTLELKTPRGEQAVSLAAVAHVASGSPPRTEVKYAIDCSTDGGKNWQPIVRDWTIVRRGDEPGDFWSQSCCWGERDLADSQVSAVRVRFHNNGGRPNLRGEAHLVYRTGGKDSTKVTFAWEDDGGAHEAAHTFAPRGEEGKDAAWRVPTGRKVQTRWVEMEPVPAS